MFRLEPVIKFGAHTFDEFPQLREIWRKELSLMAEEATKDFESSVNEPGEIFLICFCGEVVGITGWWPISNEEAGLRWHGIVNKWRGIGFGKKSLDLLCNKLLNFKSIHEVAFTDKAAEYFEWVGFVREKNDGIVRRCIESAGGGEIVLSRAVLPNVVGKPQPARDAAATQKPASGGLSA